MGVNCISSTELLMVVLFKTNWKWRGKKSAQSFEKYGGLKGKCIFLIVGDLTQKLRSSLRSKLNGNSVCMYYTDGQRINSYFWV